MKRRSFFSKSTTALLGLSVTSSTYAKSSQIEEKKAFKVCATIDQNKVYFYSEVINESIKVVHIADTHLFKDDERGIPYQEYSQRMAKAYNETSHFQTREKTNPEESFERTLAFAKEVNADVITLIGDIFSFPSEAAIEWVLAKLKETEIPYIYTAGNHDWHYEGMDGDLESLRSTWIQKRLLPLYQGKGPLMSAYDIKGVRFLAIDNSTYQINKEQLEFFKAQVATGKPLVLLVHIPMYAPGKSISFGCGNPNWGAANDHIYKIERRPQWPQNGHTEVTLNFHREVFAAPNLLGIFAGHIHRNSIEMIKGKPQIVTDDNASGGFLDIDILPLSEVDKKLI